MSPKGMPPDPRPECRPMLRVGTKESKPPIGVRPRTTLDDLKAALDRAVERGAVKFASGVHYAGEEKFDVRFFRYTKWDVHSFDSIPAAIEEVESWKPEQAEGRE